MNRKSTQLKGMREYLLQQVPAKVQTYTLAMIDYMYAMNYSASSIRNYVSAFNLFLRFNGYQSPETLTEREIVRHLALKVEQGLSTSGVNTVSYTHLDVYKRQALITEPAVGYGLAGAAVYFHSSYSAKKGPPSMTGVLGAGTQNGTWAAGAFHIGYWKHDRIRYMGALARTYANVGFYGSGFVPGLENQSVNLNLDAWIVAQQIKFRIAETDLFLGGRYIYLNTDNTFALPIEMPEFDSLQFPAKLSEATAVVNFDSRDNIFTPTKGFFLECSGTYSDTWMGGEDLYGRLAVRLIGYFPATPRSVSYTHLDVYKRQYLDWAEGARGRG